MVTIITVEEMVILQNTESEMFLWICISIYNITLNFSSTGFENLVNWKNGMQASLLPISYHYHQVAGAGYHTFP